MAVQATGGGSRWTAEQRGNANVIIQTGLQLGASWRDIRIALQTAIQESQLRNLSYGDRDSAGLFQQRPSCDWGSYEQVTDPHYAARAFFLGAGSNPGLLDIKDRDKMSIAQAAQAVQRSAYPDAYAQWNSDALGLVQDAKRSGVKITPTQVPTVDPAQVTLGTGDAMAGADGPTVPAIQGLGATTDTAAGLGAAGTGVAHLDMPSFANPQEYSAVMGGRIGQKGVDQTRQAVIEYARTFLGTPYVWGGDSRDGVDCSGLVQLVMNHAGIEMPRVSYQQANQGTRTSIGKLRPGDLVAWEEGPQNPGADHIAIYLGHHRVIEAPHPGVGVRIRKVDPGEGAYGVKLDY